MSAQLGSLLAAAPVSAVAVVVAVWLLPRAVVTLVAGLVAVLATDRERRRSALAVLITVTRSNRLRQREPPQEDGK